MRQKGSGQHTINACGFAVIFGVILAWLGGCVPLPPMEEEKAEVVEREQPVMSKAERDSIIAVYRSFAYENWKNGDFETARRQFNIVRTHDLEHQHNIYRTWADCFIRSGVLDSALYIYEEGVRHFPDDDYLRSSLTIMYRNAGRIGEATEQQAAAVRLKPENVDYLRTLAELYETTENWDAAIDARRKLVELLPGDPGESERLTSLIRTRRSPEEYLTALREDVERFPDDPGRRHSYADALLDQGQNRAAVKQFREYAAMRPDDPRGWRGLAHAHENLASYRDAISALQKVIELEPRSLADITAVGRDWLHLGNWVEARNWAQKALRIDGNYGPAWVLMGDIYFNAADEVSGERPKYNDKLVFAIAYGLYRQAAASDDPQARSDGERGMRILREGELVPSKEERFMHLKEARPKGEGYGWIDQGWPEVGYIDDFLKSLD